MLRPTNKTSVAPTMPSFVDAVPAALALARCLAKTRYDSDGVCLPGRTVEDHCRIVGAVAQCLIHRMPLPQRALFPNRAPHTALVHDVGKVTPTFQEKLYRATGEAKNSLPELHGAEPELEKLWGGHAAVSMAALKACCPAAFVADIAGQHHGYSPQSKSADYVGFGGNLWQVRRRELLCLLLGCEPEKMEAWPQIESPEQARLVAGLTIVADWIGSGRRFDDPAIPWEDQIDDAVCEAGFVPLAVRPDLSFEQVFSFTPLETQQRFYEQVQQPGVYVLEAPMGMGKTEAALYAAYGMLQKGLSRGIYFALPTQLTSNLIHARLNDFLDKILDDAAHTQALLLHGKAWLSRFQHQEMGADAAPEGLWFSQSKRGILAPFAVGTVDQALMAVMHVRHGSVRAYGLAGKTVILDEVHSYDAYTGVILEELVALLRHYGCTVIILSATLTRERRGAFTGGKGTHTAYPLVSVSLTTGEIEEIPCTPPTAAAVALRHMADDAAAMDEALLRAEQGQQVLWIENTVAEAQSLYRLLVSRSSGLEVGLVHSRFTPADRHDNEAHWTALFGKNSLHRPDKGRILVGTQVLEQSLDIDADFLVTRFCPTDMLLQRLGRLWRHPGTLRPSTAHRECWLLHPAFSEVSQNPKTAWGATGYVYMPYVLYRSLAVWEQLEHVALPQDIRSLLEATYAEQQEHEEAVLRTVHDLTQQRETLRGLALRGVSTDGKTLAEERASTRAGQRPEVDVLLLRHLDQVTGQMILADGTELCLAQKNRQPWATRQKIAAALALNSVRVPTYKAPGVPSAGELRWLRPWLYCVDPYTGEPTMQVGLVGADDRVRPANGQLAAKQQIWYRKDYGYLAD